MGIYIKEILQKSYFKKGRMGKRYTHKTKFASGKRGLENNKSNAK